MEEAPAPDFIPDYLTNPPEEPSPHGWKRKEYEDGVVVYIGPSGYFKTEYADGSVHYEESGSPRFLPTGSWFEYYTSSKDAVPPGP